MPLGRLMPFVPTLLWLNDFVIKSTAAVEVGSQEVLMLTLLCHVQVFEWPLLIVTSEGSP